MYKPINFIGHVTCLTHLFKVSLNNKDNKTPRVSFGHFIHYLFDTSRVYTIVKITSKQNYMLAKTHKLF